MNDTFLRVMRNLDPSDSRIILCFSLVMLPIALKAVCKIAELVKVLVLLLYIPLLLMALAIAEAIMKEERFEKVTEKLLNFYVVLSRADKQKPENNSKSLHWNDLTQWLGKNKKKGE